MDQGAMKTLTYYNEKTDAFVFGTQAVDFHDTQDLFLSFLPQGSSILDFGCGSGRDTRYFLLSFMQEERNSRTFSDG